MANHGMAQRHLMNAHKASKQGDARMAKNHAFNAIKALGAGDPDAAQEGAEQPGQPDDADQPGQSAPSAPSASMPARFATLKKITAHRKGL